MDEEELIDEAEIDGEDEADDGEPGEAPEPPDPEAAVESSLDELLAKRAPEEKAPEEEEENDSILALDRDERVEPLAVKVVPPQANEFTCKNCFLVKHRSQLADKRRMFCVDCA